MHFRRYFLLYTTIPLLILSVVSSYLKSVRDSDYIVAYESECNPQKESCYIGCEDEECLITYPYKNIEKRAADLVGVCSDNLSECLEAQICSPTDSYCKVDYCPTDSEECFIGEEKESENF